MDDAVMTWNLLDMIWMFKLWHYQDGVLLCSISGKATFQFPPSEKMCEDDEADTSMYN